MYRELLLIQVFIFLGGVLLLTYGSSRCIDTLSALSPILGISPAITGSVILGLATSLPEIAVTFIAAFNGAIDLSLGNAIGSYISNLTLITGVCALICPIFIDKRSMQTDIPLMSGALLICTLMVINGQLNAYDGCILLLLLCGYLYYSIKRSPKAASSSTTHQINVSVKKKLWLWGTLSFSLVLLTLGSYLIVNSATKIALFIGISDLVIGLTVVAVGTSLPELATTAAALLKGENDLALGNIVGSSIYCLLLIFSLPLVMSPAPISTETLWYSFINMGLATFFFWLFCAKFDAHPHINRLEGAILVVFFICYSLGLTL